LIDGLLVTSRERVNQKLLFYYFGCALLALAARSPDLERNLRVSNGTFGVLLSAGAVGALLAFLFVGQLVHRIGVSVVLILSSTTMFSALCCIPHVHRPIYFMIFNVILGFAYNAYNIALHDQALNRQLLSGERALPGLHGAWSLGTLCSSILAITITSKVSLAWHIDVMMSVLLFLTMFSIYRMRPFLLKGKFKSSASEASDQNLDQQVVSAPKFRISDSLVLLTRDRFFSYAYVCSALVEFSSNDWATLSSHQEIRASTTLSIVPYLLFLTGMVVGRLGFRKLSQIKSEAFWIRAGALGGGFGFVIFLLLAKLAADHSFALAFTFENLGFLIGGLGGSYMAGVITQIVSTRSSFPAGMVVAQLGIALAVMSFIIKVIISWVAQATCITFGLMIPGLMLIALSQFRSLGSRELKREGSLVQPDPSVLPGSAPATS